MEKIIYNNKNDKIVILDSKNEIIPNIVCNENLLLFNKLPSNIFDNIKLYLGKEYSITTFNLEFIKNMLTNDEIRYNNKGNYYKDKIGRYLYKYDIKYKVLKINYQNFDNKNNISRKNGIFLYTVILKEYYKWDIIQTDDISISFYNQEKINQSFKW